MVKRFIASVVCLTFICSNLQYLHAQDFSIDQLPIPGTMVGVSSPFAPLSLKGIIVNPQKPLEFQFIVDTGRGPQDTASIKEEANQLVKYFLAGLTIPENDLWVNLSPYEKDRMVPEALGQTNLGRDLLAQDYILKQLTASLIYPEKQLGKAFWDRVYAKAREQFGTTNIPVNTFNKVWILPNLAQVYENGNAAYVTKATLKVMLDEDYLAKVKHQSVQASSVSSQVVRQIILPAIENEVNTGKNFAPLRQIYQSLILAKWYKESIQNGILDMFYTNKNKVAGVNLNDLAVKEQIYERYLKAYKKGAFNYIKDDSMLDGQVVLRKYFSGGTYFGNLGLERTHDSAMINPARGGLLVVTILLSVLTPITHVNARLAPPDRDKIGSLTQLTEQEQALVQLKKGYEGEDPNFIRGAVILEIEKAPHGQENPEILNSFIEGSEENNILDRIWESVNELPFKERAFIIKYRLIHQGFHSSFHLNFDADGTGKKDYLVTVISPLKKEFVSPPIYNHETGFNSNFIIKDGLIQYIVTDLDIRRINYDVTTRQEVSSATYPNVLNSREAFSKLAPSARENTLKSTAPFKETKTTQRWYKDLSSSSIADIDPYNPLIERLLVDHRDGEPRVETYGLFDMPIKVVTRRAVIYNFFDEFGLFVRSEVYKNDGGELYDKPNYNETNKINGLALEYIDIMQWGRKYYTYIVRRNVKTGLQTLHVLSNKEWYREIGKRYRVKFENRKQEHATVIEYDDLNFGNFIPSRVSDYIDQKLVSEMVTTGYSQETRERTVELTDYLNDGKKTTLIVDSDQEPPFGVYDQAMVHTANRYLDSTMLQDRVQNKSLFAENGGINLNQIRIKRTGHVLNVQFDTAQLSAFEEGGFEGFSPVIINITRIASPFQLLGVDFTGGAKLAADV